MNDARNPASFLSSNGRGDGLPPHVTETVAGLTAGTISTLALHPLDLVKTRLQGNLAGFYRGLTPNLIGNSVSWGLYFFWYDQIKDYLRTVRGTSSGLGSMDYFIASGASGVITSSLTNPIWVIKTRMLSSGANAPGAYASFVSGIRSIYRAEGIVGFYRGFVPALFGVSHGALQFMAYERLKHFRSQMTHSNASKQTKNSGTRILDNVDYLLSSSLSKIFAGCITYPYQVLRSRLQMYDAEKTYRGLIDAVIQIWKKEHIRGFYKGLVPNLVRVLPNTCVTFLVYENTKRWLADCKMD
ncbi:hypothetical protein KEM55_003790 [Ascosphaera atra]|nr:hypothetical protein KEM55_003790 [Ascosphaera atra]